LDLLHVIDWRCCLRRAEKKEEDSTCGTARETLRYAYSSDRNESPAASVSFYKHKRTKKHKNRITDKEGMWKKKESSRKTSGRTMRAMSSTSSVKNSKRSAANADTSTKLTLWMFS